jgi:hypothetical protein
MAGRNCWTQEIHPIVAQKTYQFKLSVKDDNYDVCKTANIKLPGREILPSGLQRVTAALLTRRGRIKSVRFHDFRILFCKNNFLIDDNCTNLKLVLKLGGYIVSFHVYSFLLQHDIR